MNSGLYRPTNSTSFTSHNTASFYGDSESDSKLSYLRLDDQGKTDKRPGSQEKTLTVKDQENDPQTPSIGYDSGNLGIPTPKTDPGHITISSNDYVFPTLPVWSPEDSIDCEKVLNDARHVISVTRRLEPNPEYAAQLRRRRFWAKRHWRSRVERWREYGVNGDYLACDIDMGDPNYHKMPMCSYCHRQVTMMTQVCLRNITYVPDDTLHW